MQKIVLLLACILLIGCKNKSEDLEIQNPWLESYQAIAQTGDTLYPAAPSAKFVSEYEEKRDAYLTHPKNLDNIIWYGRFAAYKGNYREAIAIYTNGLKRFPNEPRLLRHRGHRFITIREFDKAIADLSLAAALIKGKENMIEEDGMPNAQNIPVSTLHGNIYYHLGLAYYLDRQLPKALEAYKSCLSTSSNPDNVVSATHWIYMIQNRLGREGAGDNYLRNIKPEMNVIENTSYHKACLFYKGDIPLEKLYPFSTEKSASNTALKYAIGNWFFYNGNHSKAEEVFATILEGNDWASFGYIAAEADVAKPYIAR